MSELRSIQPHDREALAKALSHFVIGDVEAGEAALEQVSSDVLPHVYTAALRLGIEAHALAQRRRAVPSMTTSKQEP